MSEHMTNFWQAIKDEETMLLATSAQDKVTMRSVSPVQYQDALLIFTDEQSRKYQQLKQNPNCCLAIGGMFVEAEAEFFGPTMQQGNEAMREVYNQKFNGAFDENIPFGGRESEFILLHPKRLAGWNMEGMPSSFEEEF